MHELLDIVDQNDDVIGQELRSICHRDKILHRGAGILIFQDYSYNYLLIQKRSSYVSHPGKLCLPGGHLQVGETYQAGAMRELKEELFHELSSLENIMLEPVFKLRKTADDDHEFVCVFRTVCDAKFSLDTSEVESYSFKSIDNILDDISSNPDKYTESSRLIINEYALRYL